MNNDKLNSKSNKGKAPLFNKDDRPVHKSTQNAPFESLKQIRDQNKESLLNRLNKVLYHPHSPVTSKFQTT